ncbi:MAG: ATP-dependent DNA helicase RecG [bacterium]
MAEMTLTSPLQYLKGVGPHRAKVLARHHLVQVCDLLFYFPRAYLDRTRIVRISSIKPDQSVTIVGRVKAHGKLYGRKRSMYEVILEDDSGAITLTWFRGVKYFERMFQKGQKYAATGIVSYFNGYQILHPELERLEEDSDEMIHAGRIVPVYPQTAELNRVGLNSRGIRKLTTLVLDNLSETITDPVPATEKTKLGLPSLHEAVVQMHYPSSQSNIESSRRRLAFDELLKFQFLVFSRRGLKETVVKKHHYRLPGEKMTAFENRLPFSLTAAQQKVTGEIISDMQLPPPMARLLQGDVGCGKTVVAILSALYVAENNLQTAFMAPTEILAEQHYRTWGEALSRLGVTSALLTSSLRGSQKKKVARQCTEGEVQVLFGTHALIYDYVSFSDLGLVIIDEQHRFGVEQRSRLCAKGDSPDLLVLTATPIPRTLALTFYGDLDISTIDSLPPGRKKTRTVWRMQDTRDKVYQYVREEAGRGGQVYIIYPVIEKSEQLPLESVEEAYRKLSKDVFSGLHVGMVHGRLKAAERDDVLARFRDRELDILLSTTVIEVGIDNPGATLMVIEHAERFGLAQLHQLRGRIGRGSREATLVALAHPPLSDIARRRLTMFVSTSDGFEIAEADMQLRGPGEMFGVRQSGLPEFRTARLAVDRDLIEAGQRLLQTMSAGPDRLDNEQSKLYSYLQESATHRKTLLGGG